MAKESTPQNGYEPVSEVGYTVNALRWEMDHLVLTRIEKQRDFLEAEMDRVIKLLADALVTSQQFAWKVAELQKQLELQSAIVTLEPDKNQEPVAAGADSN